MKRSKRERRSTEPGSDSDSTSGNNRKKDTLKGTNASSDQGPIDNVTKVSAYMRKLKKKRECVPRSPPSSSSCSSEDLPTDMNLKEEKTTDEDDGGEQCNRRLLSVKKNLQKNLPSVKKKGRPSKNRTRVLPTLVSSSKQSEEGGGESLPGNVKKLVNVCDDQDFLSQDSDKYSGSDRPSGNEKPPDDTASPHCPTRSLERDELPFISPKDDGARSVVDCKTTEREPEKDGNPSGGVSSDVESTSKGDGISNQIRSTTEEDTDAGSREPPKLTETKKTRCKEKIGGKISRKQNLMSCGESREADTSSCASMEESVSNLHLETAEVRFIPMTFHSDYYGVVLLSSDDIVAVHGCMQIGVVTGKVDISGYRASSKEEDSDITFVDVYSSNTSSLLYIQDKSEPSLSPDIVKNETVTRLSTTLGCSCEDIQALFQNVGNFTACILARRLFSPMPSVLKKLENFNGFPKRPKFFGPPFDIAVLNTNGWNIVVDEILSEMQQREDGCLCSVMLCGVGNVGKSSLSRYVVNRMLAEHETVFFLDCDCGQTEFTPPSCLSLVKVTAPILGPPFSHQTSPIASYFYGQISSGESPAEYIKLITNLFHVYYNEHRCEGPLVINTQGWMQGLGLSLLVDCIRLMQPEHIIHINSPTEKRNVPINLNDELLQQEKGFCYDSMHKFIKKGHGCTYHHLPVTDVQSQHTYLRKFKSRVSRDQCVTAYFSTLYQPFLDHHLKKGGLFEEWIPPPLSVVVPYVVRWKDVALHSMHEKVTGDVMLFAFNLSLVGLVHVDPELVKPEEDSNSVRLLIGHPVAEYIGFGIVRNIDPTNKLFYILTPVPKEGLERVNALVRGSGQLPTSYFLEDKESNRPYYCADYINVASKTASGMKPRYNLKRKPTKLKTTE